jgi:uncharacterized protein YndB with AHSA1/START domain
MALDVERLLQLWTGLLPGDDEAAAAAFRELYVDPVVVNGAPLVATELVTRARAMHHALDGLSGEVLAVADAGSTVTLVLRLTGRQVGPLDTPAGRLPATGRPMDLRVIDVLTLTDGRISSIWMVADWATALTAAGVLRLSGPTTSAPGSWELELRDVVRAAPERVYALMTEPAGLAGWWGPRGFTVPEVELDPRVGGGYRLTMQPPQGDAFHVTGAFRELERPHRLSYTFRYEEPSPDDRETVVVLTFEQIDAGTEVDLSQGPFATEERLALHRAGWTESFEKLRALVDGPPAV